MTLHVAAALVPSVEDCIQGVGLLLDEMPLAALKRGGRLEAAATGNGQDIWVSRSFTR